MFNNRSLFSGDHFHSPANLNPLKKMSKSSSKLLFLLTNPSSFLHHRPITLFRLTRRHFITLSAASNHHHHLTKISLTPIKFFASFYSNYAFQQNNNNHHVSDNGYCVPLSHPWPEWCRLIEALSVAGYCNGNGNIQDEFVANDKLSKEFVAAVTSCLLFARHRPEILGFVISTLSKFYCKSVNLSTLLPHMSLCNFQNLIHQLH